MVDHTRCPISYFVKVCEFSPCTVVFLSKLFFASNFNLLGKVTRRGNRVGNTEGVSGIHSGSCRFVILTLHRVMGAILAHLIALYPLQN